MLFRSGNGGSLARTSVNLVVTMMICGLWHGANVTFVVWGGLHGVLLAIEHALRRLGTKHGGFEFLEPKKEAAAPFRLDAPRLATMALTYVCVSLLWVFFRAVDLRQAMEVFGGLFSGPWSTGKFPPGLYVSTALVTIGHVVQRRWDVLGRIRDDDRTLTAALTAALLAIAFYSSEGQDFIYFQF